jgi:hypothetical protein
MRSARWILGQREQRGMAFVLNKWDREALGVQYDQRAALEADFRRVLADQGFADALVFKVSALEQPGGAENDLPALRAWLETGISQSTGAAIRQRRLRAAWGRLAAAIEAVVPDPLSGHPFLPELKTRLAAGGMTAEQGIDVDAAMLDPTGLDDSAWPSTPGLLGMWTRTRQRLGTTVSSLRSGVSFLRLPEGESGGGRRDGFGRRSAALVSDVADDLIRDASLARLSLGPVGAAWKADTARLDRQLAGLPVAAEAEVLADAGRRTFRRVAGIICMYAIEILIVAVLLIAAVRVGIDFVTGSYAPGSLFLTAMELIFVLFLIGHVVGSLFFPPLRKRLRRRASQRGKFVIRATLEQLLSGLDEHVDAIDQLAREGRDLLSVIERTATKLVTNRREGAGVDRLFGQAASEQADPRVAAEPEPGPAARRRPRFD